MPPQGRCPHRPGVVTRGVRLLETMRADPAGEGVGRIALWARHAERLSGSARALGYRYDPRTIEAAVTEAMAGLPLAVARVRLTLGRTGDVRVETGPLPAPPATVWVDPEPFGEAGSRYCIHKTSRRGHYERRLARAHAAGADEVILLGPDGAVVEGSRTTVWAERDGSWCTPPRTAGGLPGVMRAELLALHPDTRESVLRERDLEAADRLWLSNAVVGLVPVTRVR